jgi:hypothetical protein
MPTNNWMNALARPQSMHIKKMVGQLIQERYPKHEDLLDRISSALITIADVEAFNKLIVDIYEVAYLKCIEDHRQALERAGHKAIIRHGGVDSKPIFQEKSG